jgi:hypothetical protein
VRPPSYARGDRVKPLDLFLIAQTVTNIGIVVYAILTMRRLRKLEGFARVVRHVIGVEESRVLDALTEMFGGRPLRKRVEDLEHIVSALQASSPSPE